MTLVTGDLGLFLTPLAGLGSVLVGLSSAFKFKLKNALKTVPSHKALKRVWVSGVKCFKTPTFCI
ncbi:hypothetical protein KVC86_04665 [Helicobacter pylori]|nr:hypothetical protein KVC86_04665 [Helicobacter pylori]